MFESDADDRPPAHGYAMTMTGIFTPTLKSLLPPAWGWDQGPQFPPPNPHLLPSSLFLSLLPSKSRAAVADPSCNRMPGWTITAVRSFPNRNKAFPGGRSSKGRSKLGMGFEPATISERPYDQSG